ncbi:MAG: hypothetical protein ACJA1L_000161 [Paracoccaceae bacterium]|jgi:hypothetical protein
MTGHEKFCLENAVHFTAVRGLPFQRTRSAHPTLEDAKAAATGDGRTMIYAVTAAGHSAHICNV